MLSIVRPIVALALAGLPALGMPPTRESKEAPRKAMAVFLTYADGYECLFDDFGMVVLRKDGKVSVHVWAEASQKTVTVTFEKPSDLRALAFFDKVPGLIDRLGNWASLAALEKIQGWVEESLDPKKRDPSVVLTDREVETRMCAYRDLQALKAKVEKEDPTPRTDDKAKG